MRCMGLATYVRARLEETIKQLGMLADTPLGLNSAACHYSVLILSSSSAVYRDGSP